jgi:hypothetical protein
LQVRLLLCRSILPASKQPDRSIILLRHSSRAQYALDQSARGVQPRSYQAVPCARHEPASRLRFLEVSSAAYELLCFCRFCCPGLLVLEDLSHEKVIIPVVKWRHVSKSLSYAFTATLGFPNKVAIQICRPECQLSGSPPRGSVARMSGFAEGKRFLVAEGF